MSWPETIALCAVIIGMIAMLGMVLEGYRIRLKNRAKELELRVRLAESEGREGSARNSQLEDRLVNTERIVTDRGYRLDDEIAALRVGREKVQ
jgi:hypothetical protein